MVCFADPDGRDAARMAQTMEDNDAEVFSITYAPTPHLERRASLLVFAKVRDGTHEQAVWRAIERADQEFQRETAGLIRQGTRG